MKKKQEWNEWEMKGNEKRDNRNEGEAERNGEQLSRGGYNYDQAGRCMGDCMDRSLEGDVQEVDHAGPGQADGE